MFYGLAGFVRAPAEEKKAIQICRDAIQSNQSDMALKYQLAFLIRTKYSHSSDCNWSQQHQEYKECARIIDDLCKKEYPLALIDQVAYFSPHLTENQKLEKLENYVVNDIDPTGKGFYEAYLLKLKINTKDLAQRRQKQWLVSEARQRGIKFAKGGDFIYGARSREDSEDAEDAEEEESDSQEESEEDFEEPELAAAEEDLEEISQDSDENDVDPAQVVRRQSGKDEEKKFNSPKKRRSSQIDDIYDVLGLQDQKKRKGSGRGDKQDPVKQFIAQRHNKQAKKK